MHGGVQREIYLGSQRRFGRTRFTFVPSLFIVRKRFIEENTSSFVYLQQKQLRRINFLSTERQQRLQKQEHYVQC